MTNAHLLLCQESTSFNLAASSSEDRRVDYDFIIQSHTCILYQQLHTLPIAAEPIPHGQQELEKVGRMHSTYCMDVEKQYSLRLQQSCAICAKAGYHGHLQLASPALPGHGPFRVRKLASARPAGCYSFHLQERSTGQVHPWQPVRWAQWVLLQGRYQTQPHGNSALAATIIIDCMPGLISSCRLISSCEIISSG